MSHVGKMQMCVTLTKIYIKMMTRLIKFYEKTPAVFKLITKRDDKKKKFPQNSITKHEFFKS